jgi:hypothetical protein
VPPVVVVQEEVTPTELRMLDRKTFEVLTSGGVLLDALYVCPRCADVWSQEWVRTAEEAAR